ncbi:unnamed protein product [Clonostachys byssicola]|uniref:Uncharacterized protein n=1 Tax=Clonostachys byssicola TaxID=160290 RepID=A0A9N9UNU5_9HYPO|nr:unnamed protein product [Clonostachys byssicola]
MKFSGFAALSAVALFLAPAIAEPIANPQSLDEAEAAYSITCTGGLRPDRVCTNGRKTNGCRCDSRGTYLCDPSSLRKPGGQRNVDWTRDRFEDFDWGFDHIFNI